MSDPFSIAAQWPFPAPGIKLGQQIYKLQRDVNGIEDDVRALLSDIDGLKNICHTVKAIYEAKPVEKTPESKEQTQRIKELWSHRGVSLDNCGSVVKTLDGIFAKTRGHSDSSVPGRIATVIRKRLREKDFHDCRTQMSAYQSALQIVLSASLVYAKCGHWNGAEKLLLEVTSFLTRYLGPQHKRSRQAALFLSTVYWQLGRPSDAAWIQSSVLKICVSHLRPSDLETLKIMSELGRTRWQQGQYSAAKTLQGEILRKLQFGLPHDHADVLEAKDNLGLTVLKFWERTHFEEAFLLHSEAATGMAKVHGPDHERTLFAKENFCRAAVLLGGQHLSSATDVMNEVLETRRATLGKEHPYTLLAMVNMAIVLAAAGQDLEAIESVRLGLPAAKRTLGPKHIGTLFGRQTLAAILVQCGQYDAAEKILVEVVASQKDMASHRGDYHPDRLAALVELARCCFLMGGKERSIGLCDEAIRGFDSN